MDSKDFTKAVELRGRSVLEVCMGMGKSGIPWVPWDSHGNGNKISHGMGMGIKCMGMGVKTWELEKTLHTVTSKLIRSLQLTKSSG